MEILAQAMGGNIIIGLFLGIFVGGGGAALLVVGLAKMRAKKVEQEIQNRIETARREAETIVKEARLDAASEQMKKRQEFTSEVEKKKASCGVRNYVYPKEKMFSSDKPNNSSSAKNKSNNPSRKYKGRSRATIPRIRSCPRFSPSRKVNC